MLILASSAGDRPLFRIPPDEKEEANLAKRELSDNSDSDHFATMNAFRQARHIRDSNGFTAAKRFMENNFIHREAFNVIEGTMNQILNSLTKEGLIPEQDPDEDTMEIGGPDLNQNSKFEPLIKALITVGFYPNLAMMKANGKNLMTAHVKAAGLHPSSINSAKVRTEAHEPQSLFTFSELSRNDNGTTYLR